MPTRRRRILLVMVVLAFALGLVLLLLPRNEPKYEGRYLSEWMFVFAKPDVTSYETMEAEIAVENIGTNGLPLFLAWLSYETPQWKMALHSKLPDRIARNRSVTDLLGDKDVIRAMLGVHGICILGPSASSAIPELKSLMQNRTNIMLAGFATEALAGIGRTSLPVLQTTFADTNQLNRDVILWNIHRLSLKGYSNECLPILKAALEDHDIRVRSKATNLLQVITINQLYSMPQD